MLPELSRNPVLLFTTKKRTYHISNFWSEMLNYCWNVISFLWYQPIFFILLLFLEVCRCSLFNFHAIFITILRLCSFLGSMARAWAMPMLGAKASLTASFNSPSSRITTQILVQTDVINAMELKENTSWSIPRSLRRLLNSSNCFPLVHTSPKCISSK